MEKEAKVVQEDQLPRGDLRDRFIEFESLLLPEGLVSGGPHEKRQRLEPAGSVPTIDMDTVDIRAVTYGV